MDVSFITTSAALLDTIPVVDGQVIAISDATGYYYDMSGERRQVSNVMQIDDDYASTSTVYSSSKVDSLISAISQFTAKIVTSLPLVGDPHTLYFVKKTDAGGEDNYDEWMYISDQWEHLGNTKVSYQLVSHTANGLMSAQDKIKLDGIAEGAQVGTITGVKLNGTVVGTSGVVDLGELQVASSAVTHPEGESVGTSQQGVYVGEDGALTTMDYTISKSVPSDAAFTDTTYEVATQSSDGLLSADDKKRLDSTVTYNGSATGSATQGIYVDAQGAAQPMTYSVNKSVPEDAVFTDTTYTDATESQGGLMSSLDKTALDSLVSKFGSYDLKIVESLPEDPDPNTFYIILES